MEIIRTEKFTDHVLSLRRMLPLEKKTITALNLMIFMFNGKSEKYPDREQFSKALNHAYSFRAYSNLQGYGGQVLFDIRFSWIASDWIDDPHYKEEVLDLMKQILFHPLLDQKGLDEAKYLLSNRLQIQEQDPDSQAVKAALRAAGENHPISVPVQGILDDIDQVTLEDIQALWQHICSLPFEIYGVGRVEEVIEEFAGSLPQKEYTIGEINLVEREEAEKVALERNVSQSSLAQVYSTGMDPRSDDYYGLLVMNSILGASPMSLLFEEIREKHSYCYSISSSLIRFDGAILILTGALRQHMEDVKRLISQQIEKLQTGSFSDDQLRNAKLDLLDSLTSQQDSPMSMITQRFINSYLGRSGGIEAIKAAIEYVSKEDVVKAAQRLRLISEALVLQKEETEAVVSGNSEEELDAALKDEVEGE